MNGGPSFTRIPLRAFDKVPHKRPLRKTDDHRALGRSLSALLKTGYIVPKGRIICTSRFLEGERLITSCLHCWCLERRCSNDLQSKVGQKHKIIFIVQTFQSVPGMIVHQKQVGSLEGELGPTQKVKSSMAGSKL